MKGIHQTAAAVAVVAALGFATVSGQLVRPVFIGFGLQGYAVPIAVNLADLAVLLAAVLLATRCSFAEVLSWSGLAAPVLPALAFAIVLFVPAAIVCMEVAPVSQKFDAADFAWLALGAPLMEEFAFRGVALGTLMRFCGWRLVPAALLPALLFGAAHAANGNTPTEVAGIVAITGLGGLVFGWLFVRWGFNLWAPFVLHAGLNGLWLVFDLGENAIGGWFGNALRFAIAIAAVALTFWLTPKARGAEPEPA